MPKNDDKSPQDRPDGTEWLAWGLLAAFLLFVLFGGLWLEPATQGQSVPYSEMKRMIREGEIDSVTLQEHEIIATRQGTEASEAEYLNAVTPAQDDPELLPLLEQQGVEIMAEKPPQGSIFSYMLPWIVLLGFYLWFQRRMIGNLAGGMGPTRGGLLTGRFAKPQKPARKITFDDVAGQDQAKREVSELIDFLREPERFQRLGAEVPHGVLLMGPPGTGKTLMAKALAGEADVPFFSTSGSEFIEIFVGVGAGRVRAMFEAARKAAPSVVFIDELDSIGRTRGTGLGGGHDEREQTLNQILAELDGFSEREAVVVLAATNRPDVLDPALLRPGRFDRQVVVSLPDIKGREKILRVHMKRTPIASDVDPVVLAKGTPGFSGADLENLVNEAALLAAKRDKERLDMMDFEDSKDKVYMGLERKSKVIKEEDRLTTAYHEGGHALVARFIPGTDAVNKITIIPRGRAAGVTWFLPEERDFRYKDQLEAELAIAFGGRVAEEIVFDRISTGAANDIKKATELAQQMIRSWGMSEVLGPLSFAKDEEQVFLGREIAQHRDYSEETARKIDSEINNLVTQSYERARSVLTEHLDVLHKLAEQLLEKETILGAELDELIRQVRPGIQLPEKAADSQEAGDNASQQGPEASGESGEKEEKAGGQTDPPADDTSRSTDEEEAPKS